MARRKNPEKNDSFEELTETAPRDAVRKASFDQQHPAFRQVKAEALCHLGYVDTRPNPGKLFKVMSSVRVPK
jgi:hypothetical protein